MIDYFRLAVKTFPLKVAQFFQLSTCLPETLTGFSCLRALKRQQCRDGDIFECILFLTDPCSSLVCPVLCSYFKILSAKSLQLLNHVIPYWLVKNTRSLRQLLLSCDYLHIRKMRGRLRFWQTNMSLKPCGSNKSPLLQAISNLLFCRQWFATRYLFIEWSSTCISGTVFIFMLYWVFLDSYSFFCYGILYTFMFVTSSRERRESYATKVKLASSKRL